MSALEKLPRTIDIGCHVPHGAVRAYVMGERGARNDAPTEAEIAAMSRIVEEGLRAGALGFSTSRTVIHKSIDGELVPGTTATADELIGIGRAMARVGHGVFEMASDLNPEWNEFGWMEKLSKETGLPVTFAMLQSPIKGLNWIEQMRSTAHANDNGANVVAQISLRGTGILMNWRGTVHPFRLRPSWQAIAELSWPEQYARLSDPAFKAQLLAEDNLPPPHPDIAPLLMIVTGGWGMQFPLGDVPNYEPMPEESIAALAAAQGRACQEIAYDMLMADDGNGFIYLPLLNYADGNLDFVRDLLLNRDDIVISLSDGGAHCGTICDAASPTFLLQHWVRDRARGTIPLELAVRRQCRDTALLYGLNDRGLLRPGYLADLNVIDLDALALEKPYLAWDLPAGGRRLLQKARGYVATVKSGEITFRDGKLQPARPGKVIRGPRAEPMAIAAE